MIRFARIAAILCIAAASVTAHAQLQLTCPVNWDALSALSGDPDQLLFGVKVRDWKSEFFDTMQSKNEECMTEAKYPENLKKGWRINVANTLNRRDEYLRARDENVRRIDAAARAPQTADNANQPPVQQSESATSQDAPEPAAQQPSPIAHESSQQTATPIPARQAAPVEPATSVQPPIDHQGIEISSLQWKLIALALLANVVASIYLHAAGKLTIYRDYTDASFTGIAPLISIIAYFALRFFEVSPNIATMVAAGVFAILLFFVVKATARNNRSVSVFFVMSLITKVTIIGLFYALMALLIFTRISGSPRREGESYATFEARQRREAHGNAALMAIITAGLVALSVWVCKHSEFTPIDEYFSPKTIAE